MKNKAFFLISILIISCNIYAKEETFVELPKDSDIASFEYDTTDNDLTFFEKFKAFFGFSDKKEESVTFVNKDDNETSDKSGSVGNDLNIVKSSKGAVDDNIETATLAIDEKPIDLKLPSDFQEFVEEDTEIKSKNEQTASSDEAISDNINTALLAIDEKLIDLKLPSDFQEFVEEDTEIKSKNEQTASSDEAISNNINTATLTTDEKPIDLKLPSGFQEFVEEDTEIKSKNEQTASSDEVIAKDAEIESKEITDISLLVGKQELQDTNKQNKDNIIKKELLADTKISRGFTHISNDITNNLDKNILKYQDELNLKYLTDQPITQITDEELTHDQKIENFNEITSAKLDKLQLKFINDESLVLMLPNDDVVLGELTENAQIYLINFVRYTQSFWNNYNKSKNQTQRDAINKFIDTHGKQYSQNELELRLDEAFKAINANDISLLRTLLNNYPILNLATNKGNTLLHKAAYIGNYSMVKLLLLKGINIFTKNKNGETALKIAKKSNHKKIISLIQSAIKK